MNAKDVRLQGRDQAVGVEVRAPERTLSVQSVRRGRGRFSNVTFGSGDARRNVINVVGASRLSIDWNCPQDEK